ncbi:MAG: hypothetical protein NPINA01_14280 [Nitrospinaceae bacterium]|nr:MAG: hypothetical protein NPINA01_14280 [Nitrospinaceae bacterium]
MKTVRTILVSRVVIVGIFGLADLAIPINKMDRELIDASENNNPSKVQERSLPDLQPIVKRYKINRTGALILITANGSTLTARRL